MHDVSATGLSIVIQAHKTFPAGIQITAFADDADPLDLPAVDIAQTGMDINGNLVTWSTPTPQTVTINVLAGSEEDENLESLHKPIYPQWRNRSVIRKTQWKRYFKPRIKFKA